MSSRLVLLLLLVPALLLAQALGLAHGVRHAQLAGSHGAAMQAPAVQAATPGDAATSGEAATSAQASADCDDPFGAHDAPTCRLVDQLAHGDLLGALALPVLPVLQPPAVLLQALAGLALARWAALFDARGPPASR